MKLLFLTNLPSPYRVNFFNLLSEEAEITVIYERKTANDRQTEWKAIGERHFSEIYLNPWLIGTESSFSLNIISVIRKQKFDLLVIMGYSSPTSILAISYCQLARIPYWVNCDGTLPNKDTAWNFYLKRFLIGGAAGCLCSGSLTRDCLSRYIRKERCHVFPFSSLYEKDILPRVPSGEEKKKMRHDLNLKDRLTVISVGNFIPRKGFDILLEAAARLSREIEFLLIGGTPLPELVLQKERLQLDNVHFVQFMQYDQLRKYYQAADLFVLPTRYDIWGLVIHEAMANALPVITTRNCGAGLELIEDGINGFLVDSEQVSQLSEKISAVLNNPSLQTSMAADALSGSRRHTLEKMKEKHLDIFRHYLQN